MPDLRAYISGKVLERPGGLCPYLTNSDGSVLPGEVAIAGDLIHCDSKQEPAALHVLYRVDDFGEVVLKTLPLPETDDHYNLNLELARAKLAQIDEKRTVWAGAGFEPDRILREEIECARDMLKRAEQYEASSPARAAALAERSLTRLVWAGEGVAVEAGRHGIKVKKANGSAREMKLGANLFGFVVDDEYNTHFAALFNAATLPFHWRQFEPEAGAEQWHRVEAMLQWARAHGITPKGHPLVSFRETDFPQWARSDSFDEVKRLVVDRVRRIVSRYADHIDLWDVITEAHHVEDANMFNFSRQQLVEITAAAASAARKANPDARTIVNVSCPFGEYAAGQDGSWCPLDYLRACVESGVDFDIIGVELCFGSGSAFCRDLLEMSDLLDLYGRLGKPVHVTRIGCPSSDKPDPYHMLGNARVEDAGRWHGKWSETLQAEWVEKLYTICCGKPFVEAVMWWDLADCEPHYFTHGGLLRHDLTPKPACARIARIADDLGISPAAG